MIETRNNEVVTPYTSAFLTGPAVTDILLQNVCPLDQTDHIGIADDTGRAAPGAQRAGPRSPSGRALRARPSRDRRLTAAPRPPGGGDTPGRVSQPPKTVCPGDAAGGGVCQPARRVCPGDADGGPGGMVRP